MTVKFDDAMISVVIIYVIEAIKVRDRIINNPIGLYDQ